jgi:hypothetical protein
VTGDLGLALFSYRKIKEATLLHIGMGVCEFQTLDTDVARWRKILGILFDESDEL